MNKTEKKFPKKISTPWATPEEIPVKIPGRFFKETTGSFPEKKKLPEGSL